MLAKMGKTNLLYTETESVTVSVQKIEREINFKGLILTSLSPDRTSNNLMSMRPSRRSTYRSWMRHPTLAKWEFTHLQKVFFWTASLSSVSKKHQTWTPARTSNFMGTHTTECSHSSIKEDREKSIIDWEGRKNCILKRSLTFQHLTMAIAENCFCKEGFLSHL